MPANHRCRRRCRRTRAGYRCRPRPSGKTRESAGSGAASRWPPRAATPRTPGCRRGGRTGRRPRMTPPLLVLGRRCWRRCWRRCCRCSRSRPQPPAGGTLGSSSPAIRTGSRPAPGSHRRRQTLARNGPRKAPGGEDRADTADRRAAGPARCRCTVWVWRRFGLVRRPGGRQDGGSESTVLSEEKGGAKRQQRDDENLGYDTDKIAPYVSIPFLGRGLSVHLLTRTSTASLSLSPSNTLVNPLSSSLGRLTAA